jgi:hypothetical protein
MMPLIIICLPKPNNHQHCILPRKSTGNVAYLDPSDLVLLQTRNLGRFVILFTQKLKLALGATNLTLDFCNFYHTDMPKRNFKMSIIMTIKRSLDSHFLN